MNAESKKHNSFAAVAIIVLVLLLVLGIGLYVVFSKPAPVKVITPPTPTVVPQPSPPPAPEPTVATGPQMLGQHKVIPKDTLWWISNKWYQDPVLWPSIYEINKSAIHDPDLIFPGQNFDIPALTGTSSQLSPGDKSLLAQGYLEAYRVYKEKGKKDAEDYKRTGDRLNTTQK